MATYSIKNVETNRFVTSLGDEEAGDPVDTYFGSAILTFSKALDGSETLTSIKGDAGLYISPGPGDKMLIWSEAEFIWNAVLTSSTESYYELIPADGENLYWAQNTRAKNYIILLPGSQIVGKEAVWKISAA